jgi:HAD superfamily hydrolase (TIGR01509 family)
MAAGFFASPAGIILLNWSLMPAHDHSALGAIFDWDGVIIDSSRQHEESWERLAAEEGRTLPAGHFKEGFGKKNEWIIPNLLRWSDEPGEVHRLSLRKEALYRVIVLERGLEALPGVREFLERLRVAGVPCCIGSSTHRENIAAIIHVLGFEGFFAGMVTAEDVTHGKPHPDVFLKAAAKIGRAPASCVVFEDAFAGLEAAHAGGMKAVAVATTHPAERLAGRAHRVVHRLDELTVADLAQLVSG